MGKRLIFGRTEFIRDYYETTWDEKDYQDFIDYLSKQTDVYDITRYKIFKDLSFEDICKIFNNEKDDIEYKLTYQCGTDQYSYSEFVTEYIRDMLREDCWSMGSDDSECYDAEEECKVAEVDE